MKLNELEAILFKSASPLMKQDGEKAFRKGLVTYFNTRKIEELYHIYGRVRDEAKLKELNTHIKINLKKKKLEGAECTCEEFKEFASSGYTFMCSHLTATAFKFLSLVPKNKAETSEKREKPSSEKVDTKESTGIGRLIRKTSKGSFYFEAQRNAGSEKIILQPNELRGFLESLDNEKIKFKYDYIEFVVSILREDLPITFNLKENNCRLVLTTHKKLPEPLNSNNDVYFFKNELYLPSRNQIERYAPLYNRLKEKGEILYKKDIGNYNRLITLLRGVTKDINISEEVRDYAAEAIKPEFYLYREKGKNYCTAMITYGNERFNILSQVSRNDSTLLNHNKEEKIVMKMEKLGFIRVKDKFVLKPGDEELFYLVGRRKEGLHSLGTVILGKGLKDIKVYNSSDMEGAFYENDGCFKFDYKISGVDSSELGRAFSAFKSNHEFYRTSSGDYLDFDDEGIKGFFHLFDVLNLTDKLEEGSVLIENNKALFLQEQIRNGVLNFIKDSKVLDELGDKLSGLNSKKLNVPEKLKAKLREYQVNGFKWMKTLSELGFGGILADEMGLGKTVQTIAFMLSEEGKRTIIVCPTSLNYNWKAEIERFAPTLKAAVAHGPDRLEILNHLHDYDVILTSYGTLRMDMDYYSDFDFDFCIIDEGQNIKNFKAQNTRVVKEIKARVKFALTGTPIENNLTELWSIFDFIMPGYLYTRETFQEKFIFGSKENIESLKLLIKPFTLRRTKAEVMNELPDKIEKKFIVEMTDAQKDVYNSYAKTVRDLMKNSKDLKIEVFSYLTRLRQICLDPSLVFEDYDGGSGKMLVASELVKENVESNGKVLLFSQFTSVLDKLGKNLSEQGIKFFRLDGRTKSAERIRMVNEFNSSDDVKVFLISLKAGGTGLNLTSANLVIHFDPWWNPAVEDQATDRAHRIGQRNVVEVIKLVARGTVEEKIIMLQEDKRELIDSIITGELQSSSLINKMSKEDLLQLFSRS